MRPRGNGDTATAKAREPSGRGRPRVSSRSVLEEAAYELFLEQGYDGTTVAEIARRSGVSRGTFFNYFPAKADVFWGDIDEALDRLGEALRKGEPGEDAPGAVRAALTELAEAFGPERVPWILTQFETIGAPAEVGASALTRMNRAATILGQFVAERTGLTARALQPRTTTYASLAVVLAAAQSWAEAGPQRGRLATHIERAFDAV